MDLLELSLLLVAAFIAGLIDAVVGGGGLIQVPALFAVYPQATPASLFGTNKLASIFGTASAAARYARSIDVPWRLVLPAAISGFLFGYIGAMTVSMLPRDWLRPLVLALLIAVTAYTWFHKDFGEKDGKPVLRHGDAAWWAALVGGVLGFYDGFFGPGTGSFLIFAFVRLFGMDFLRASASAKIINAGSNLAALLYFGAQGYILWWQGGIMALCNIAGAVVGTNLALARGAGFVRRAFLFVASLLIIKVAIDTFGAS